MDVPIYSSLSLSQKEFDVGNEPCVLGSGLASFTYVILLKSYSAKVQGGQALARKGLEK